MNIVYIIIISTAHFFDSILCLFLFWFCLNTFFCLYACIEIVENLKKNINKKTLFGHKIRGIK